MASRPQPLRLLADIGGTNTRVALAHGTTVDHATIRRFANADHGHLTEILTRFVADAGAGPIDGACVAAAGPVRDGVAEMTNLSWVITSDDVARATGARRVAILNDLQAQGHALDHVTSDNLRPVIAASAAGTPPRGASRLVIGVGTGFNAAPVHFGPGGWIVPASECGHISLPIRDDADVRVMRFVESAHGFPCVEDVLSGRGLERVLAFVTAEAGAEEHRTAADIMAAIAQGSDRRADEAGQIFVRMLGNVAGNLSLIHLPFGGVYLIGGVARAFAPYLARFGFAAAFRDKGRFAEFMANFAVHLLVDDYAALTGCTAYLDGLAD